MKPLDLFIETKSLKQEHQKVFRLSKKSIKIYVLDYITKE